jgi:hypothetical protein
MVFNGSVGKALYTLEGLPGNQQGLFVRGDGRAIISQNAYTITQLYYARGENAQQLVLCYRPLATALAANTSNGKPFNIIRLYIISLNSSEALTFYGSFHLKISALNITSTVTRFEFNSSVSSLALQALSEDAKTTVWLPIESTADGAIVSLEILTCHIEIRRVNA